MRRLQKALIYKSMLLTIFYKEYKTKQVDKMCEYFSVKPGEYVHFIEMSEKYYSVGIYKNQELDE